MKRQELYNVIATNISSIMFEYEGINGLIDPYNENEIDLCYGDTSITVDLKNVMITKMFNGKSLEEICDMVEFEY